MQNEQKKRKKTKTRKSADNRPIDGLFIVFSCKNCGKAVKWAHEFSFRVKAAQVSG